MTIAHGMRVCLLVTAAAAPCARAAAEGLGSLEPYQMVRSLQLVQDRLADGDDAALPMQRKLLELIDARLIDAAPSEFQDERNFDALLIYGMSGGNPRTLETVLPRVDVDNQGRKIGDAIVDYLRNRTAPARQILLTVDPMTLDPELGAFLALVEGSLAAQRTPQKALGLFDVARLLSPGTLVEEAALRRSVSLCTDPPDAERFLRASEQYVRRFLYSPYASQFAESFVAGVVALRTSIDLAGVAEVIADMNHDQARAIYLRIARQAVIGNDEKLLAFTAKGLEGLSDKPASATEDVAEAAAQSDDPRQQLYMSMGSLTSETIGQVAKQLAEIDRSRLSPDDRKLLDAAKAIADEVMAIPEGSVDATIRPASIAADLPPVETPPVAAAPDDANATAGMLAETQKKLDAVDKLLQETDQ